MRKYLLLFFLLVISSCSDKIDESEAKRKIEDILHLSLPNVKKINNYHSHTSFNGDFYESFELDFQLEDFDNLLNSLNARFVLQTNNSKDYYLTKSNEREVFSIILNNEKKSVKYTYIYE